jgi:hypothetical protein
MDNQILEELKGLTKRTPGFAGGPCDLKLIAIDYLFKYDLHSHFTFHIDQRLSREPDITVVVKVTADKTTMQVAGAEKEASSTGIGDAQVFLSRTYHRSGQSTARTVLVSFFYSNMTKPANPPSPMAGGEAASPSTGQKEAAHESARPQVVHNDTPPQGAGDGGEVASEDPGQKEDAHESVGAQGEQDETPPQGAGGSQAACEAIAQKGHQDEVKV